MALSRTWLNWWNTNLTKPLRFFNPDWLVFGNQTNNTTQVEATSMATWSDLVYDGSGVDLGPFAASMHSTNPNVLVGDYILYGETRSTGPTAGTAPQYLAAQTIPATSITHSGGTITVNLSSTSGLANGPWNGAIQITGSSVATDNGIWPTGSGTITVSGSGTTLAFAGSGSGTGTGATILFFTLVGSGNWCMDNASPAWMAAALAKAQSDLGNYPYDLVLADVMGIVNLFASRSPTPIDPETGVIYTADKWMKRVNDFEAYQVTGLGIDSTGIRIPYSVNGYGDGGDFWGVTNQAGNATYNAYPLTAIPTISGTKVTYTVSNTNFGLLNLGPSERVIVVGNGNGLGGVNGIWTVSSVNAGTNTITVETYTSGLTSSSSAGTIQRSSATRVHTRVDSCMSEEWMRGENSSTTNWPGITGDDDWFQNANAAIQAQLDDSVFLACTKMWVSHTHQQFFGALASGGGLTSGNNYTTLSLTATSVSGLGAAVPAGATLELQSGSNSQFVVLSSSLANGATVAHVVSFNANFSYPAGAAVNYDNQDGSMDSIEDPTMDQWHKLCMATALLVNNGKLFWHFRHDFLTGAGSTNGRWRYSLQHPYYSALLANFGPPSEFWNTPPASNGQPAGTGTYLTGGGISQANQTDQGTAGNGVYRRYFFGTGSFSADPKGGCVLVNPDTAASHTYALPTGTTYANLDVNDATVYSGTVTVAKNTGLILVKQGASVGAGSPMVGLTDQSGVPAAGYGIPGAVQNQVCKVYWADIQPTTFGALNDGTPGSTIYGTSMQTIDAAIIWAKANPGLAVKIRVYTGIYAPITAQQIVDGTSGTLMSGVPSAPWSIEPNVGNPFGSFGIMGAFHTPAYRSAVADMMTKLSNYVPPVSVGNPTPVALDDEPVVQDISVTGGGMIFMEPTWRFATDPSGPGSISALNVSRMVRSGFTPNADLTNLKGFIADAGAAWNSTACSHSINVYSNVDQIFGSVVPLGVSAYNSSTHVVTFSTSPTGTSYNNIAGTSSSIPLSSLNTGALNSVAIFFRWDGRCTREPGGTSQLVDANTNFVTAGVQVNDILEIGGNYMTITGITTTSTGTNDTLTLSTSFASVASTQPMINFTYYVFPAWVNSGAANNYAAWHVTGATANTITLSNTDPSAAPTAALPDTNIRCMIFHITVDPASAGTGAGTPQQIMNFHRSTFGTAGVLGNHELEAGGNATWAGNVSGHIYQDLINMGGPLYWQVDTNKKNAGSYTGTAPTQQTALAIGVANGASYLELSGNYNQSGTAVVTGANTGGGGGGGAFVGQSPLATGNTSITPVYAGATAGNTLILTVSANQSTPAAFTLSGATTGWTQVASDPHSNLNAEIWMKLATGADTMPSVNGGTTLMEGIVSEYTGQLTLDQVGTSSSATSPITVTAAGTDGGTGRLIITVIKERNVNVAGTVTFADSYNHSGTAHTIGDNGSTSQNSHHHSSYCNNATTGGSADANTITVTGTFATAATCLASFAPPAAGQGTITKTSGATWTANQWTTGAAGYNGFVIFTASGNVYPVLSNTTTTLVIPTGMTLAAADVGTGLAITVYGENALTVAEAQAFTAEM